MRTDASRDMFINKYLPEHLEEFRMFLNPEPSSNEKMRNYVLNFLKGGAAKHDS